MGFREPSVFPLQPSGKDSHQHVHGDTRTVEREWSALKRGLMLTLEIAVGTASYAGAIQTIFAWSGGSL